MRRFDPFEIGQGNVYVGSSKQSTFVQGTIPSPDMPSALLDGEGKVFGKNRPQYEDYDVSQFVSVKDFNATGDGKTDDLAALQAIFNKVRSII